jgi:branched-chain amino acid transport system ATP-binding protein
MLTVEDLVVAHGSIQAVQGVSLALSRGEIVALIGPNGAGKTSLVRAIAGLHRPARGRVSLDGSEVTDVAAERIVRLGAVLVPEGRMIFGTLTVRENLMIGAYTRRNASEVVRDVARIGRRFPVLAARADQLASQLSGGERQLLAIGRALMSGPTLMIVDEPSHGLAPLAVRDVFSLLTELNAEGMGILLVEQNARQSLRIAHRAYVMRAGRVALSGNAAELRRDESVVRAYLGVKDVGI